MFLSVAVLGSWWANGWFLSLGIQQVVRNGCCVRGSYLSPLWHWELGVVIIVVIVGSVVLAVVVLHLFMLFDSVVWGCFWMFV